MLGYAPQLPLEAVIAEAGGFPDIAGPVTVLEFWRLSGGDPPGEIRPLAKTDADLRAAHRLRAAGPARPRRRLR